MVAGVTHTTGGSFAVRTPARSPTQSPDRSGPAGRNADRESSAGASGGRPGGLQTSLGKNGSSQGRFAPPHSADASTTAGRDRIDALGRRLRQAGDVGWIANEADPGRGRAVAGAASLAAGDDPRGQGGHRETARGLQTSPGKNVLYKGGLQPPPGDPGLKAVLERPCSPIPCDEGKDLLKGSLARGISGESGGLALHPRAFSGKESDHPPSGPRPGLVPGCRRRPGPQDPIEAFHPVLERPNDHGQESRTQGRPGQGRPRSGREGHHGQGRHRSGRQGRQGKAAPAPATKAPPKAANTPAPVRPKPANRTVVYTALAETTGLGKKEVAAVFSALGALIARSWARRAPVSSSSPAS